MPHHALLSPEDLAETILVPEYHQLRKMIEEARGKPGSHIAILGEPYSGREYLVKRLARDHPDDAVYISFSSPVEDFSASGIAGPVAPIIFIEGAHYLFTKKVGGFRELRAFKSFVVSTDRTVISSWNTHAWEYACAVEDIDAFCSGTFRIPPLTMQRLMDGILAFYHGEIRCINDATIKQSVMVSSITHTVRIPFLGKEITLPGLSIDWNLLISAVRRKKQEDSPEKIVFSRLESVSKGNMGIALRLWNQSLDYPEIRVSRIHEISVLPDLTIDERFLLATLLMTESAESKAISQITGESSLINCIYPLKARQLIEESDGTVRIRPAMLNQITAHLRATRMVI
jgi:hypothetical protein